MASAFIPDSDSEDELPPGWEERATIQGEVYYANHNTHSTQWVHPRTKCRKRVPGKLPFGWKREIMADGGVLYVNHETQKTTFSDPRLAFAVEENAEKTPFRQRFDASTTADQILHGTDLSGKVAVITGASKGGIGFEVAKSLACHGCHVVIGARDVQRGCEAIDSIIGQRRHVQIKIDVLPLNLLSFDSVQKFSHSFKQLFTGNGDTPRLDLLILNAATMGVPFQRSEDGYETMFQTNYLSQFYLTLTLMEVMKRTQELTLEKPKVIYVSSESHRFSNLFNAKDFTAQSILDRSFISTYAYNQSKLYGLMFIMEASTRWKHVNCLAVHPGNMVSTNLSRNWWLYRVLYALVRPFAKSLKQAAGTVVFAAASTELRHSSGMYLNNCFPCNPDELVWDLEARKNLWIASLSMISHLL